MSRKKKLIAIAVIAFVAGFIVRSSHHEKSCKQIWSQYTDLPGKCVVKMGY